MLADTCSQCLVGITNLWALVPQAFWPFYLAVAEQCSPVCYPGTLPLILDREPTGS